MIATTLVERLWKETDEALAAGAPDDKTGARGNDGRPAAGSHHPLLLQMLAEALECAPSEVVDFELNLCDTQASCVGGALDEFIYR